jgi:uncharacterized damage-inducible protein DinB
VTDLTGGSDRRAKLTGFLDWYRGVVERKVDDLTRADATRVATPTGVTLLGAVRHLRWCERLWFAHYFLGRPHDPETVEESFVLAEHDTTASVVAAYRDTCAQSRAVVDVAPLDQRAVVTHRVFGVVDLEWIVLHMIEETARHAGHMDVLRELTDGRTGD